MGHQFAGQRARTRRGRPRPSMQSSTAARGAPAGMPLMLRRSPAPSAPAAGPVPPIQRKLLVDDPTGSPAAAPAGETNEEIARDYVRTLCSDFDVLSGEVVPTPGACLPFLGIAAAVLPESCGCLCEMTALGDTWTIVIDDADWPHTDPSDKTVHVHSPFSGVDFGAWTGGPDERRVTIDNWLVLGHELCGHALLIERGTHPASAPASHGGRTDHDATIEVQNQIAAEHGVPASELRGLFADTHHGESIARLTVAGFPFGSADVTALSPAAHAQLDVAETFIRSDPDIKIDVVGHADRPARTPTANARISRRRAENVGAELEIRGIDPARFMEVSGAGAAACPVSGREPSCRKAEIFLFPREGASGSHR